MFEPRAGAEAANMDGSTNARRGTSASSRRNEMKKQKILSGVSNPGFGIVGLVKIANYKAR